MRHEALTLMTVAERHGPRVTYDSETMQNSRQAQHSEGDRILAAARQVVDEVLGDRRSGKVDTEFLFAHPLATLIDASKDMRLVVVGCRGMSALDRLTLGSVSSGLVRHAHCPVAVIHKEQPEPDVHAPILLGIDGSPASEFATAVAFDEASHRRAPLIAMHAWADSFTSGAHLNSRWRLTIGCLPPGRVPRGTGRSAAHRRPRIHVEQPCPDRTPLARHDRDPRE